MHLSFSIRRILRLSTGFFSGILTLHACDPHGCQNDQNPVGAVKALLGGRNQPIEQTIQEIFATVGGCENTLVAKLQIIRDGLVQDYQHNRQLMLLQIQEQQNVQPLANELNQQLVQIPVLPMDNMHEILEWLRQTQVGGTGSGLVGKIVHINQLLGGNGSCYERVQSLIQRIDPQAFGGNLQTMTLVLNRYLGTQLNLRENIRALSRLIGTPDIMIQLQIQTIQTQLGANGSLLQRIQSIQEKIGRRMLPNLSIADDLASQTPIQWGPGLPTGSILKLLSGQQTDISQAVIAVRDQLAPRPLVAEAAPLSIESMLQEFNQQKLGGPANTPMQARIQLIQQRIHPVAGTNILAQIGQDTDPATADSLFATLNRLRNLVKLNGQVNLTGVARSQNLHTYLNNLYAYLNGLPA